MDPFSIGIAIIGLLIGMGVGAKNAGMDYNEEQEEIIQAQQDLEEEYNGRKEQLDNRYKAAKEEAGLEAGKKELQAQLQDDELNIQERALDNDINSGIEQLKANDLGNLWSWNNALASIGANAGEGLATVANSGVRAGSSMAQAVELEATTNNAMLQMQQDYTRKQQKLSIANLFSGIEQSNFNIYKGRVGADQERFDALDLRNSWEEGGRNWQGYQDNLNLLNIDYQNNYDRLEREYKRNEENYTRRILTAMFNKGSQGAKTGYNAYNTWHDLTP